MNRSPILIATLVAFGLAACGEQQKPAATAPAIAKPEAAAPAPPPPQPAPAGEVKKEEKK